MNDFQNTSFVIFDVETTGLSPKMGHRVIEMAAIKIQGLKVVDEFHSLVNPGRDISFGAFMVHGISSSVVHGAPSFKDIFPRLNIFLGESILIGHNIRFDLSFLSHEAIQCGLEWEDDRNSICTVKMAKTLLPDLGRYPLWLVAQTLGLDVEQEHRAMADVYLNFEVFKRLLAIAQRRDIFNLEALVRLFGNQTRPLKEESEKIIQFIEKSIQSQSLIALHYFSRSQGHMTFRTVLPEKLIKENKQVYLVGYCHFRKEKRNFKLDQIIQAVDASDKG